MSTVLADPIVAVCSGGLEGGKVQILEYGDTERGTAAVGGFHDGGKDVAAAFGTAEFSASGPGAGNGHFLLGNRHTDLDTTMFAEAGIVIQPFAANRT